MRVSNNCVSVLLFLLLYSFQISPVRAQQLPLFKPSPQQMVERYQQAAFRDSAIKGTISGASVQPHWMAADVGFWYVKQLADSIMEYVTVSSKTGQKKPLFNKQQLAARLSEKTKLSLSPEKLLLNNLSVASNGKQLNFEYNSTFFRYTIQGNFLEQLDSLPIANENNHQFNDRYSRWESYATDEVSPNRQYTAYIANNNVFIKSTAGTDSVQYTKDGTDANPYGSLAWSPDSKYLVGYKITPVVDQPVYYVLTSQPGTTRGQLKSQPYKQPGDPFTTYDMYLFPVASKQAVKVNTEKIDFFEAPYLHWTTNNQHFLYEKVDRGHQRFRIIDVDVQAGNTKTIYDEKAATFIYESRIFTAYLPATNEVVFTSEKDGWRHLYLLDASSGAIKSQITRGNFVVKQIDSIDAVKREIWFSANGMNEGEDPYYVHYYRIGMDGKNLVALTPEKATHTIRYSPSKKYYLDTYSEINVAPKTTLRETATGKLIAVVEQADISRYLEVAKRLPQTFVARGRDGITDIYGVYFLPADFDSTKSYPVIENIYAGPHDAFVPKSFIGYYREMQSLADLGFVVVQIDGMGTANRSKAFHDVCWQNIADAGFPDRILWIKALAAKYGFADASRVGLYGTSAGGQSTLGGLLFHPEFYKAGVAACGCHDNRVDKQWWNEQWMGYPVGSHYAAQSNVTNAAKLQGKLLLIVGEADTNVPPESSYRVADALIKAGKTFDFLPVPGMGHSDGGVYGRQRKRDFFVQHLLGVTPPERNNIQLH